MMNLDFIDFIGSTVEKKSVKGVPDKFDTRIDIDAADIKNDKLNVLFSYRVNYEPEGTFINLYGVAGFSGDEIQKGFDKSKKKISDELKDGMLTALNHVCSINAVFIARVFDLAPPIIPVKLKGVKVKKQ